jgi:predicted O-methyltransferase YrrM
MSQLSDSGKELCSKALTLGAMQIEIELQGFVAFLESRGPLGSVLEIGCALGGMTHVFARLAGQVTTVCYEPYGAFGASLPPAALAERNKRFDEYGNVRLIHGNSHHLSTFYEVSANVASTFDVIFIDGDHTLLGVQLDHFMYSPFVSQGGVIVFHDIKDHGPTHRCQVSEFWRGLRGKKTEIVSTAGTDARWGGIGILHPHEQAES